MATVPTPTAQTAGIVVPAATINSQGNLATYLAGRTESGGARKPLCVMRQTVAQTLTTGVLAAVTFDVEDVDYDNGHSTTTNTSRYVAGTAGWYDVKFNAAFAANATGSRQGMLRVNGTTMVNSSGTVVAPAPGAATSTHLSGGSRVFLNVNDYIELVVDQESGGNLNTAAATSQFSSGMSIAWLSV